MKREVPFVLMILISMQLTAQVDPHPGPVSFHPSAPADNCGEDFTDTRDGQVYQTVLIGDQCWMKENLNIGVMIPGTTGQANNGIIEKYCYDNTETNCDVYGGLYEWAEGVQYLNGATNQTSWDPVPTDNVIGICPAGWYIPTDGEITALVDFLGGWTIAGGKMKEAGYAHWAAPNTGATNSSGFTSLPGGSVLFGSFQNLTYSAYFWSSTEYSAYSAWYRFIGYLYQHTSRSSNSKVLGLPVRCLKGETPTPPENRSLQNISIPQGQVNCYDATQTITVAGDGTTFTVLPGGSATLIAGQNILCRPGTLINPGGYLHALIAPSGPWCNAASVPAVVTGLPEPVDNAEQSLFMVWPNPVTAGFTLELPEDLPAGSVMVEISDIFGKRVVTAHIGGERKHEFGFSDPPAGVYIIRVVRGDQTSIGKIVKR